MSNDTPNMDEVICPKCVHQFRAIPVNVQEELAHLRDQLPEGMKHCTILFKECTKGHGWLTATNWIQHECPTCEQARLREELELIRAALTGDDYASLPSDLPTVRMAHTVRADHDKFRNQVRDTCHRAEQAEARALAAEKDAETHRSLIASAGALIWYAMWAAGKLNSEQAFLPHTEVEQFRKLAPKMEQWLIASGHGVGINFSKAQEAIAAIAGADHE